MLDTQTGVILRAYPIGTDRVKVIEDFASNQDKLEDFILYPSKYKVVEDEQVVTNKEKTSPDGDTVGITMDYYRDGSCVVPRQSVVAKKSYNLNKKKGEW